MVACQSIRMSSEVTPSFGHAFLNDDLRGELHTFATPIAFRPHYNDSAWGDKVHEANEHPDHADLTFIPVKNGEAVMLSVTEKHYEEFRAVVRRNTIDDEVEHLLHYMPAFHDIDDDEPISHSEDDEEEEDTFYADKN